MLAKQKVQQIFSIGCFVLALSSHAAEASPKLQKSTSMTSASSATIVAQANPQLVLDPNLVGLWVHSNTDCSSDFDGGNFCLTNQLKMLLQPDGRFYQGDSSLTGGGSYGSIYSNTNGVQQQGEWITANRILYGRLNSTQQWTPVARYYIENGSMLLTYGDGTKEVWKKSY